MSVAPVDDGTGRQLSVVMPLYNEADVISDVIGEVQRVILDAVEQAELVVVDDCGTDGSRAIVENLALHDHRIRLETNPRNAGHGPSVLRGFDASTGQWMLLLDSDGQIDLSGFPPLWDARDDADLVAGVRMKRADPKHRLVLTRAVNLVASALSGRRVPDANAGCKLVRRAFYQQVRPLVDDDSFAPSILLVIAAARSGARLRFVGVPHRARRSGPSTLRLGRLLRAVSRSTAQSVTFRYRNRSTLRSLGSVPKNTPECGS